MLSPLTAISPVDGRYHRRTSELHAYFSEYALIKYRLYIEIEYFIALCKIPLPELKSVSPQYFIKLKKVARNFSIADAAKVKAIEKVTNHDVKAVEYFLKEKFDEIGLAAYKEFIHFGLTSQDVNNTAIPLSLKHAMIEVFRPMDLKLVKTLETLVVEWKNVPMLARTHGQPASPTLLGKEIKVFTERFIYQLQQVQKIPYSAKFGGATGNFNAHFVAYPDIDWVGFANKFVNKKLGLKRTTYTTQIEPYDNLAALCHGLIRLNTILIDLCRDIWTYIAMDYFKQKVVKGEVGSSTMPHKVNPIDFENAEGNLGLANAILTHLAQKLPISRLQRDLTDSTVLRNLGVPLGHMLIALKSLLKGLDKLLLNSTKLHEDLENNWAVVTEAIQSILRREGYPKPYEALKTLSRGKAHISKNDIHNFIDSLAIKAEVKTELKTITPHNYVGVFFNDEV